MFRNPHTNIVTVVSHQGLTRRKLLSLTIEHFHAPFPSPEVKSLFDVTHFLLRDMRLEHDAFDKTYDSIIIGSLILAMAQEAEAKGNNLQVKYPKSMKQLLKLCDMKNNTLPAQDAKDPRIKALILAVGEKALAKYIPFETNHLDSMNLELLKHIPMHERLERYALLKIKFKSSP